MFENHLRNGKTYIFHSSFDKTNFVLEKSTQMFTAINQGTSSDCIYQQKKGN